MFGVLVCEACRLTLTLGDAIRRPSGEVIAFDGALEKPVDGELPELTRALWKFLADHVGHRLRVASNWDDDFEELAGYVEIGGDELDDIPFEEYLDGWPG